MKKFLIALLLVVPFWAGAQADPYADVDPSDQTVVFWHQHTRDREASLQQIITEFNETNEYGITVEAEYQGGYGDIFQKMLPLLGTGDTPNLVVAYQNQAATYQLGDGLIDMSALVNSPTWGLSDDAKADFFEGFYSADVFPTFGDARLGFPPNRSMEVMYYNSEWLAELGYDAPPATPEEFREMACAASEQGFSEAMAPERRGYELSVDASRFASWTFAFGGNIFDYDAGEYTYNSDAAIEAMTFLQELFADGCATQVTERFGDQTNFGAGTTLFTVGSSSGLPFYESAVTEGADFDWSVAAIPHVTEAPVMNLYGASVSMPQGHTPEEELATWLFVEYYTSAEAQADWAVASNYFPVRRSVANNLGDYFDTNPAYASAFELLEFGQTEPPTPGYDFVRDIVEIEMTAIMDGADVTEILEALNEEANEILQDQLEQLEASN